MSKKETFVIVSTKAKDYLGMSENIKVDKHTCYSYSLGGSYAPIPNSYFNRSIKEILIKECMDVFIKYKVKKIKLG